MFSYGQVKGFRYDTEQKPYEKKKPGKRQPVYYGAKKFKSVTACARYLNITARTVFEHIRTGKPYRGARITR